MPGWALSILGLALILPALVVSTDALARVRRRRSPVVPWLLWVGARFGALVLGLLLAYALALTGAIPEPFDAPVTPGVSRWTWGGGVALGDLMFMVVVLASAGPAPPGAAGRPRSGRPSAPGAVAVALALSLAVLVLWIANPFAALLMVPALHLWMLATLVDPPPPRRARIAMVAAGLLAPALVVVYYCSAPVDGPAQRRLVPPPADHRGASASGSRCWAA